MENRTAGKRAGRTARRKAKKVKPAFNVLNLGFFKSVKSRWRKPRGTHNKKRMKFEWAGALPHIGYRNPPELRGVHPSGKREVLVHNVAQLEGLSDVVLRIASAVGAKKRKLMVEKAKAMNLVILNARQDGWAGRAGHGVKPGVPGARPGAAKQETARPETAKPEAAKAHHVAPVQKQQARRAAPPRVPEPPSPPGMKK